MKFYILAGEKSGDLHASNLVKALGNQFPEAVFRGFGGDLMQQQGVELAKHYKETAFMGFWEVIKNLSSIQKLLTFAKKDILAFKPDAVIFVDYPGFNLRIAKFLRNYFLKNPSLHTPKLFYYISPKLWAWNQGRAKQIKRNVDFMFSILPFEIDFYKKFDFQQIIYVGNPLFDAIQNFEPNPNFLEDNNLPKDKKIIALLAGSRKQEVTSLLPIMLEVSKQFDTNSYQFVIAGVDSLDNSLYEQAKAYQVPVIFENTYNLLSVAEAAVVASGTATLETALFSVPQVVVYKVSPITYQLAKLVIKVKWVSLVNLIANKEIVKELLQYDCTTEKITTELTLLLDDKKRQVQEDYQALQRQIQTEGVSLRTAKKIKELMQKP